MNPETRFNLMSAAMILANESLPKFYDTNKHAPINGRIVGWDNGKTEKPQKRNELCSCGSGKKFKKCCILGL